MPSVVDFGTRTTMPEGGCIDLWRRYLLGNLSWGFVWFVPAFWIMELLFCCVALVSVISPWARASLRSLCNKTGITISPSWLENSQGFDKYSRYFLLNHFKQKQRSKEKKKNDIPATLAKWNNSQAGAQIFMLPNLSLCSSTCYTSATL